MCVCVFLSAFGDQVRLWKKERMMEYQSECLSACQRVIDEQEEELLDATKELDLRERKKISIQHSLRKRGETGYNRCGLHL